jgi:hypothetical protein
VFRATLRTTMTSGKSRSASSKSKKSARTPQAEKFKQAAREVGANSTEEEFSRLVRKVTKGAPSNRQTQTKPR